MVSRQEKGRRKKLRGRRRTPCERERHSVCHETGRGGQDASDACMPARATPKHGCKRGHLPRGCGGGCCGREEGGSDEERENERVERERDKPPRCTVATTGRILVASLEICVPSTSFVPRPSASITPRRSSHTLTRRATYVHHHLATVAHPRALDDASSTSEKPSCHAVAPGKLPFR
ncbi:hypothetical protein GW17_00018675 [Ensete ventricosum]|nr:hypothetical protein GW17_00018675 [Ensete ventricosum]